MMRQGNVATKKKTQALVTIIIWSLSWLFVQPEAVSGAMWSAAVVAAIEGKAEVSGKEPGEQQPLEQGMKVESWQTVSTDEKGKVMLRWEHGLVTSLGGFSTVLLSSGADQVREVPNIQVLDGLVRVATQEKAGNDASLFFVTTPIASMRPENPGQPIDFLVEVYEPSTTVVTVITGNLRITKLKGQQPKEEVVSACNTVYVEQDKPAFDRISLSPEDLRKLVEQVTIQGTMYADLDSCPLVPAVPPAVRREVSPRYAGVPQYDYIEEDVIYAYPWDDIRVISVPTYRNGIVCFIPGYGRYIIPYSLGYAVDPFIWQIYLRHAFIGRALYYDRIYYNDLIYRRNALNNVLYLAGLAGNHALWWDARRQLRYLDIQSRWAAARISNLQRRVSSLEKEQRGLSGRVPAQVNLANVIAHSFNSPTNRNVVQRFESGVKTQLVSEKRLAAAAGQELADFRARISGERDPQRRLDLRNQFAQVREHLDKGKIPVSAKQPDVKGLAEMVTKTPDPADRARLQQQLLGQLAQRGPRITSDQLLSLDKLKPLKQGIAAFPDAQKRPELEKRFVQLEQSIADRKHGEAMRRQEDSQVQKLREQFARERDSVKKDQLLQQLQQLRSMAPLGTQMKQSPQETRQPQRPLVGEGDRLKLEEQRRALEQQRKNESDLKRQQQEALRKQAEIKRQEQIRLQQEQLKKQTEMRRLQQEDQRRQVELKRQQQQQQIREQQMKQQQLRQQDLQRQQQRVQEQVQRQQQLQRQQEKLYRPQPQQRVPDQLQRQQQQRPQEQFRGLQRQPEATRPQSFRSFQQAVPKQVQQTVPKQVQQPSRSFQQSVPRQSQSSRTQQSSKGDHVQAPSGFRIR